jgi:hypothetical protein
MKKILTVVLIFSFASNCAEISSVESRHVPESTREVDVQTALDRVCGSCGEKNEAATPTQAADTSTEEGGAEGGVPTQAAALLNWLEEESYGTWPAESAPHASSGAHFGRVRTFFNPSLAASLQQGNASHPVGAAAVKEILDDKSGQLRGWAVSVKTQPAVGPEAWFWFDHVDGVQLVAEQASPVCTGCHSSGVDSVRPVWAKNTCQ